ncbi:MAG: coenzyme F420-0:L-glutamate ligase [Methyloligellaceae bacterium]
MTQVTMTTLEGVPLVQPGDDLAALLIAALERAHLSLEDRDVLVVVQKVVSKAEGRIVDLDDVTPSERAVRLARETGKDPRHVETILAESDEVVRHKEGVIVVAHRLGHVMANAGIDRSNVEPDETGERVLLLPEDPDVSAARLKQRFDAHFGVSAAVIVADSVGRAWRLGTVGLALGAAGLPALMDRRGEADLFGRPLEVTMTGFADGIAAAATLVMGEGGEGRPAVLVRGLDWEAPELPAAALIRPKQEDMFR